MIYDGVRESPWFLFSVSSLFVFGGSMTIVC